MGRATVQAAAFGERDKRHVMGAWQKFSLLPQFLAKPTICGFASIAVTQP